MTERDDARRATDYRMPPAPPERARAADAGSDEAADSEKEGVERVLEREWYERGRPYGID